jgi:hypothetical protein
MRINRTVIFAVGIAGASAAAGFARLEKELKARRELPAGQDNKGSSHNSDFVPEIAALEKTHAAIIAEKTKVPVHAGLNQINSHGSVSDLKKFEIEPSAVDLQKLSVDKISLGLQIPDEWHIEGIVMLWRVADAIRLEGGDLKVGGESVIAFRNMVEEVNSILSIKNPGLETDGELLRQAVAKVEGEVLAKLFGENITGDSVSKVAVRLAEKAVTTDEVFYISNAAIQDIFVVTVHMMAQVVGAAGLDQLLEAIQDGNAAAVTYLLSDPSSKALGFQLPVAFVEALHAVSNGSNLNNSVLNTLIDELLKGTVVQLSPGAVALLRATVRINIDLAEDMVKELDRVIETKKLKSFDELSPDEQNAIDQRAESAKAERVLTKFAIRALKLNVAEQKEAVVAALSSLAKA